MTTGFEKSLFRERLSEGDIVYFINKTSHSNRPLERLRIQKATITSLKRPDGSDRNYSCLALWGEIDEDPLRENNQSGYFSTYISPLELFTTAEVEFAIHTSETGHGLGDYYIDDLIMDLESNSRMVAILEKVIAERTTDGPTGDPYDT
jgi:hypothetical protein